MKEKISFVRLDYTSLGGAESYLKNFCESLTTEGIDYEIIHGNMPKWFSSWIKALWFNVQVKLKKNNRFYFSLARITSADVYRAGDGVHRAYMKALGLHFWQNPLHLTYCYLERKCFRNAKKIITNSELVKNEIIHYYKISSDKIIVIPNGVKIPKKIDFLEAKKRVCKQLKISFDKKIILFVGSGFRRKGVDRYLEILSRVKSDYVGIVIGKDKKVNSYRALAKKLGIFKQIYFLPVHPDISDFYAASDIFLFPVRYEPFGNVVLEAMAHHCAVITTEQCGTSRFLPAKDIISISAQDSIINRIDMLLTNADLLETVKDMNFTEAKKLTIHKNVTETLTILENVLSTNHNASKRCKK